MDRKFMSTLCAALIGSTALSTVAFAQSSENLISQGDQCGALAALTREEPDRLNPEWLSEAATIVQSDNEAQCMVYYDDATTALAGLEAGDAEAGGGRILVTQPEPSVTIQQDAPEVVVTQPAPEVTVRQGQPEIIVRQAQPTVTVRMPQPVIIIDQPQPEIIVRMPDPVVGVTMPDPDVQVSQNEPSVSVEQAPPEVEVQLAEPDVNVDGQSEANVTVNQESAIVRLDATEATPNVNVQQESPMVTYEAAEPNVVIEESGEPRVEFTESGEPNIRFEEGGEQVAAGSDWQPHLVGDIQGMAVVDAEGTELGNVDRLVTDGDRNFVVIADGGLIGLGEDEVILPLSTLAVADDRLVVTGISQAEIAAMQDFDTVAFQDIGAEYEVNLSTQ